MKDQRQSAAEARAKEIRARAEAPAFPEEYEHKRAYVEMYLRPLAKAASGMRGALQDVQYSTTIHAGRVIGEYVRLNYWQNVVVTVDVTGSSLAQIGIDVLRRLA